MEFLKKNFKGVEGVVLQQQKALHRRSKWLALRDCKLYPENLRTNYKVFKN